MNTTIYFIGFFLAMFAYFLVIEDAKENHGKKVDKPFVTTAMVFLCSALWFIVLPVTLAWAMARLVILLAKKG